MQQLLTVLLCLFCCTAFTQKDQRLAQGLLPLQEVPVVRMPTQDNAALQAIEAERSGPGIAPRYATNISVDIDPATDGVWESTPDAAVWRLRIQSPTAHSLNLGFTKYNMPEGGQLILHSGDYQEVRGPFTPADNEEHEQLWTPLLEGEEIVIEVQVPERSVDQLQLELSYVNHAFQSFGALISGSCNLDVICDAADGWGIVDPHRDIIQSVAVISTGGGTFCTGFLVNNVEQDCTPFFMTADHCGINAGNAPSLVTYWNYENSVCRQPNSSASGGAGDGQLNDFNTGAIFRASRSASDFVLVQLDDPVSPTADAYLAGWDATGSNISSAIGIHHPRTDEKRISFENDATQFTNYGGGPTANYTHVRVVDWDVGTTEGGSSGSPLFDQDERVVGQLHGGGAACGNNSSDWYGSFAISWDTGTSSSSRLRDWLDPNNTGTLVINGRWASDCSFSLTANPSTQTVCEPLNASYSIQASSAFPSTVNFSTSGLPAGASASFSPSSVTPGGTTTLTIQTNNINPGTYTFTVTGNAGGNEGETNLSLTVLSGSQTAPDLLDPSNNSTGVFPNPVLSWEGDDSGATTYEVQLSTNSNFSNIIETGSTTSTNYQPTNANMGLTRYYWRVRASNTCGVSNFSSIWSFVTQNFSCVTYESSFSTTISEVGTPSILNDIFVDDDFEIASVTVSMDITHTYVGDLDARLQSPGGSNLLLFDRPGFPNSNFGCDQDNLLLSFSATSPSNATELENTCNDSDTGPNNPGAPYAISGSYRPVGDFNAMNGQSSNGLWSLEINDNVAADGGILEEWSVTVCYEVPSTPPQLITNNTLVVPHSNQELITDAELAAEDDESSAQQLVYTLNSLPSQGNLYLNGQLLNINQTFTQADINNGVLSYQHNGGAILTDEFDFDLTNAVGLSVTNNTFSIEITVAALQATLVQTAMVNCNGDNTAALQVNASGGVVPYNYSLNGGMSQSSNIFQNLTAGTYTVSVTDNIGTTVNTSTITINNPTLLTASLVVNNNVITVTASGGTTLLQYQLNGGAPQNSNVFSGLANGSYNILVTDANGCMVALSATVAVNTLALNANLTQNIDCFNDNDGQITITATGGTPPLTYRLNGGAFQNSPIFSGLAPGTYTPEVMDSEGFSRQTTAITISNPTELTANLAVNISTITVSANGGTGSLQYQLNGGTPQNSNVFSGLANGSYNILVTDANGCMVALSATVAVNTLALNANLTQNIDCFNDNDGQITITATGGTPPLTYRLNGGAFQNSPIFSGLAPGTYTPEVMDSEGFSRQTTAITISNPTELTANLAINASTITVSANGGTGSLQYQLNGGTPQNSNVFSGLANGSYNILVTDANGCMVALSATVAVNTLALNANLTQNIDCFNDNDGQITITASGGTPPLTYRLNGGAFQNSPIFSGLAPGTYTPEVMDSEGFSRQTTAITISNPTELTANLAINASTITVNANGGTGSLQYQLNGGTPQNSNVFSGLPNGGYNVFITDANGCTVALPAIVSVNTLALSANLTQNIDCFNDNDGQITITASGGTPPLTYRLNGGAFQNSPIFSGLAPGTYTPEVMDSEGFSRQTTAITISNPTELTANLAINASTITVNANGGTGSLQYQLNGGTPQNSNVFSGLPNGGYNVFITDANGCTVALPAIVSVNTLALSANLTQNIDCFNDNDGQITITASGGTPPLMYRLNGGPFQSSPIFSGLVPGTYFPEVIDTEGFIQQTTIITIDNPTELTANLMVDDNTITVMANGGTGILQYQLNSQTPQTNHTFVGLANGSYIITIVDANGCSVTLPATVSVNTLALSANLTQEIDCFNDNDGQITISAVGGTPPLMYRLNAGAFQDSPVFSGLPPGTYTPRVMDSEGFSRQTTAIIISNPLELTASLTVNDDVITVTANGGTGSLQYQLNDGTPQSSNIFGGLANGSYNVLIADANGCMVALPATISVNTLSVSVEIVAPITCANLNDAVITANVIGGTAPFTYRLNEDSSQDEPTFSGLGAGEYTITVEDAEGFSQTTNTVVIENPAQVTIETLIEESTVTITATGGTGELEYSLDGINWQSSPIFTEVVDGIYQAIVRDENGCVAAMEIIIAVNSLLATAQIVDGISCTGATDGSLLINVEGGIAPYLYRLNDGAFQESNLFENLGAGLYNILIEDQVGTSFSVELEVMEPSPLAFSAEVMEDGISVIASGGTAPYSYQLNGEMPVENPLFSNLPNGDYTILVTDANGCTETAMVSILVGLFDVPSNDLTFAVYPNPNQGQFTLELPAEVGDSLSYRIFNSIGQLIEGSRIIDLGANYKLHFDLNGYPSGVYQVVLIDGTERGIVRVIVE